MTSEIKIVALLLWRLVLLTRDIDLILIGCVLLDMGMVMKWEDCRRYCIF